MNNILLALIPFKIGLYSLFKIPGVNLLEKKLLRGMGGMNNTTRTTTKRKEASSMEPMAPESTPALKGAFNLPTLQHTMEVTTDKKGVNVVKIVVECPKNIIDFNQLELDLSDKTMRLKVPGAQPFVLKFPQKVLSTQTKAKFKKKNNSLVVSIPTSQ